MFSPQQKIQNAAQQVFDHFRTREDFQKTPGELRIQGPLECSRVFLSAGNLLKKNGWTNVQVEFTDEGREIILKAFPPVRHNCRLAQIPRPQESTRSLQLCFRELSNIIDETLNTRESAAQKTDTQVRSQIAEAAVKMLSTSAQERLLSPSDPTRQQIVALRNQIADQADRHVAGRLVALSRVPSQGGARDYEFVSVQIVRGLYDRNCSGAPEVSARRQARLMVAERALAKRLASIASPKDRRAALRHYAKKLTDKSRKDTGVARAVTRLLSDGRVPIRFQPASVARNLSRLADKLESVANSVSTQAQAKIASSLEASTGSHDRKYLQYIDLLFGFSSKEIVRQQTQHKRQDDFERPSKVTPRSGEQLASNTSNSFVERVAKQAILALQEQVAKLLLDSIETVVRDTQHARKEANKSKIVDIYTQLVRAALFGRSVSSGSAHSN